MGLSLDSTINATIDGVTGPYSWYAIGAKRPIPQQGLFLGVQGHAESINGGVTAVNLYSIRQFGESQPGI